jgi:putative tryptophan/tyrosine transport system substrate-binding protein
MKRRQFIAGLGSAAAWPVAARAQQPARLPTIGVLAPATVSVESQRVTLFVQRMRELGWIEGRTITIEPRFAEGRSDLTIEIVAEFVRRNVDVIFTGGTGPALAAKQATATIPIVFAFSADPVGSGLVASLARPGGNVTGMSLQSIDTTGKRIELLRKVVTGLHGLAILANGGDPASQLEINEAQAAARSLGLAAMTFDIRRGEDIAPAFESLVGSANGIYVAASPLLTSNRTRINTLAAGARLPTVYVQREYVEAGGLMSYGPNIPDLYRRAADFVDKILRRAKPADIPVEQPTRFDLVINLATAKALGLTIPETLLATADEVIQ